MQKRYLLIQTLLFATLANANALSLSPTQYYAVFDCGSSGTRLYVYQNESGQPKLITQTSNQIELDKYVESANYTIEYNILDLLKNVQPILTQKHINPHQLEINILATAGMRYVDSNKQNNYYKQLTQRLTNAGYTVNQARTISGSEEALFSWLAVNQLANSLNSPQTNFGIFEVGGASAQIAFATTEESGNNITQLHINGQQYNVYNKSFLGLGKNKFYQQFSTTNDFSACLNPKESLINCSNKIKQLVKSNNDIQQPQTINKFKTTTFYGIDNVYNYHTKIQNTNDPNEICTNLDTKECVTKIYINTLIDTLDITSIKPINKINGTKLNWTNGFVYTIINNIHITN